MRDIGLNDHNLYYTCSMLISLLRVDDEYVPSCLMFEEYSNNLSYTLLNFYRLKVSFII